MLRHKDVRRVAGCAGVIILLLLLGRLLQNDGVLKREPGWAKGSSALLEEGDSLTEGTIKVENDADDSTALVNRIIEVEGKLASVLAERDAWEEKIRLGSGTPAENRMIHVHAAEKERLTKRIADLTAENDDLQRELEMANAKLVALDREQSAPVNDLDPYDMIILVLSARDHVERRAHMRATIAMTGPMPPNTLIRFIVGEWADDPTLNKTDILSSEMGDLALGDILVIPEAEAYSLLPAKLKFGYKWVADEHPSAKWVAKLDDDMMVWPIRLNAYCKKLDPNGFTVVGANYGGDKVHRDGKWAELHWKPNQYPNFPLGSFGHIVSAPVVRFVAAHGPDLFEFQGEDTSIGIWLAGFKVNWIHETKAMRNDLRCSRDTIIVGHSLLTLGQRKACLRMSGLAVQK